MKPLPALAVLGAVLGAVYLRDPTFFDTPRFWAEEGSNYFQSAVARDVPSGLLNVGAAPHNPYVHPVPQIATVVAAHAVPLEEAPSVTTFTWLAVLVVFELVVLFGGAELLDPPLVRVVCAASPLLAVGSAENWANTLGAHFFLDFALLLLWLEGARATGARRTAAIAGFAGLALFSPTAFILTPALFQRALLDFKRQRPYVLSLGFAVAAGALVHKLAFAHQARTPPEARYIPHLFLSKMILWPLAGHAVAERYGGWIGALDEGQVLLSACVLAPALVLVVGVAAAYSRRDDTTRSLLVTWLFAAASYLLLGIGVGRDHLPPDNAGRYAFLPGLLLLAFLAHQVASPVADRAKIAWAALLGCAVAVGISGYRYSDDISGYMHGAPWAPEVRRFREDRSYERLRIAPNPWTVVVSHDRP
ncbi:MAG TPA: hypothetical protein VHE30_07275 [Polyangiaceae bacterium]|nr:hypothetical protein [Polyangiaceae bacterium]